MKNGFLLLLIALSFVVPFDAMATIAVPTSVQQILKKSRVTINLKNKKLDEILADISKQSKVDYAYQIDNNIDKNKIFSLVVNNVTIEEALNTLFKDSPYTYRVVNNRIVIVSKGVTPTSTTSKKVTIKGKVIDASTNKPISGALVLVDGTQNGAIADADGNFLLSATQMSGKLNVTCVGYETQTLNYKDNTTLQIKLKVDVMKVDEVTVVAYGTQKTRNVLGAISGVKAKDLEELPTANLQNLLQGQMAGVEVNNVSGSPGGGGTKVNIRGYNSLMEGSTSGAPLYVIDGVPVSSFTSPITGTNTLAEIDPATIESVEVLKDAASAAIYGSRASNGVILITTKQGKSGKGKFSVNYSQSFSILPETPLQISGAAERRLKLLMARNLRSASGSRLDDYVMPDSYEGSYGGRGDYDYFWNNGTPQLNQSLLDASRIAQDSLNNFYNNSTNWWKYCFRTGLISNANVQASGGNDNVKYMVGAGFYNEEGIMIGSDFSRLNLITNLNITPRKNLQIDARLYAAYTDRSKGAANTSFGGAREIEGLTVDPKVNSTLLPGSGDIERETLKRVNETIEKNKSLRLRGSLNLAYSFLNDFRLSTALSVDYTQSRQDGFVPSYLDARDHLSMVTGQFGGNTILTNENLLNYHKSIGDKHNFDVLVGHSYMITSMETLNGSGKGGPSDKVHYVGEEFPSLMEIAGKMNAMKDFKSNFEESAMLSYFGRFSYNYKQKYLLEATLRRDGSSVFGENVRWATFPSAAIGWAFSEEKFMKNLYWLDFAKLRLSWGRSGNTFDDPYLAHGIMQGGNSFLGYSGMSTAQILNQDLTWEETDQYNLGFDFQAFDNRVKLKAEYYYKYSRSLLWKVGMPGNVYGHKDAFMNVLEISNEGFELEAIVDIFRNSDVSWRTKFNIATNSNRFEKSYTNMDMEAGNKLLVLGRSINGLYVYRDKGIIHNTSDVPIYYDQQGNANPLNAYNDKSKPFMQGMRMLEDINMDGTINDADRYYAAQTLPVAHGGWANEIKWRNLDLNMLFTYSLGRHIINNYSRSTLSFKKTRWEGVVFEDYREGTFWEKPGDVSTYPIITSGERIGQYDSSSDRNIEKVSYVRLKQLTLGYNMPARIAQKLKIEGVRLFLTAENLFLLTNYSGLDPETVSMQTGYDNFDNYPLARKFTLGLTIKF